MFRQRLFNSLRFKRSAHSNSIELSALIKHMVTQKTPETVYSYQPSRLVKFGSWSLALTFVTYGLTFSDWAFLTTQSVLEDVPLATSSQESLDSDEDPLKKKHPFALKAEQYYDEKLNTPQNRYYVANAGIALLTAIPFVLATAAIYFPGRIVKNVKFLPLNQQIEVTTLYNKTKILDISKCELKGKLYTGSGPQLCEDKSSFSVFLLNNSRNNAKKIRFNWARNLYIISRSGSFFRNDCRFFDVLFKKKEILEEAAKHNRYKVHKTLEQEPELTSELIKMESFKTEDAPLAKIVQNAKKASIPKPISKNSKSNNKNNNNNNNKRKYK